MLTQALVTLALLLSAADSTAAQEPLLPAADWQYLTDLTEAVVEASRVAPGAMVGEYGPNSTGGTLIRPGGRECYPAFWIRDYAMSIDAGFISGEEQRHALWLTASLQQDVERPLSSGSVVPVGAIADHITFSGKPIFYPGVLDDFEGQGGPKWGKWPCYDDHFYFVLMAAKFVRETGELSTLHEKNNGKSILQRMAEAFEMPPSRADTHLVYATDDARGVNFGFFDTVVHTGDLLFASVLKYEAAIAFAELRERQNAMDEAKHYRAIAEAIRRAVPTTFGTESGFLRASTGTSGQADVWGTAYAVYVGLLDGAEKERACDALARAYTNGTIAWEGMIRHVPTDMDFSAISAWEIAYTAKNTYQNGAYWGTATGWVCYAIAQVDRALASQLAREYVAHLRKEDFRLSAERGAPWECMHPAGDHRQNPVYMAGVTCPLAAFRRIAR